MGIDANYRHELKYQIGMADYLAIRQRLRPVLRSDPHAGPDGRYTIRSIYFDNFDDKALREKLAGVQRREKFRIRWYNDDLSRLTLEKKLKHDGLCKKLSARLTETECRALLDGETDWMRDHPSELVRELRCKLIGQQLRPRVLVSYTREPYIYAPGNVRVTFDGDLRTSLFHRQSLEPCPHDVSAADRPGDRILEVKYDAFLPEVVQAILQTNALRQQAYSKYTACRRFG